MSTFGKVLAILNAVVAAIFIWVAVLDYSKHQAWAFHVLQEDFTLHGLPIDETERNADGDLLVEMVGNRMATQLFSGAGQPVKTQTAEVKARQAALLETVNSAADTQAKKAKIEEIVLPLAHSAVERANLHAAIQKAEEKDLGSDGPFLGSGSFFDTAFQDANRSGEAVEHRRDAIARFLFCTGSPENFQRTMTVVGLEHYSREVERQATALADMVPQVEVAMADERADFVKNNRALIQEIIDAAERVRRLQDDGEKQKAQLQQYNVLIADRNKDIVDLRKQIQTVQDATRAALAKQGDYEKALFEAQKQVATTNAANQRLETEIKTRELGR
jgi:hypothetical protein